MAPRKGMAVAGSLAPYEHNWDWPWKKEPSPKFCSWSKSSPSKPTEGQGEEG